MNNRIYWIGLIGAIALAAAACGSSEPVPDAGAAPQDEATTTTEAAEPEPEGEAPAADPNGIEIEDYLVAFINTTADWEDCVVQVEEDANAAQSDEPTEQGQLEYAIAYVGGHIDCWQGEHDAIAALQPSAEAASAHAGLVDGRAGYLAAMRTGFDQAETVNDYFPLLFEPPPDVVAAYIVWVDACRALQGVATSSGIDADLRCPFPQTSGELAQVTVFTDGEDWLADPPGVIQDEGAGVEVTIVNPDDVAHKPMIIFLFSGSSSNLPIVDGLLDLSRCGVSSDSADSSQTFFGCEYPESPGDNVRVIDELAPGDSVTVMVGSGGGTLVVLDYLPGAYEAGRYAVIEVLPAE